MEDVNLVDIFARDDGRTWRRLFGSGVVKGVEIVGRKERGR
jgi:hypothetical protein